MSANPYDDNLQEIDTWVDSGVIDEEHGKLVRIAIDELVKTHQMIERSPKLKDRGQPGMKSKLLLEIEDLPRHENEDWDDYLDRIEIEGEKRGEPFIMSSSEEITYWQLDNTNFVYIEGCRIGTFSEWGGEIIEYPLTYGPKPILEEIIPSLRLLRTPFYGAVLNQTPPESETPTK